jgi:RHS repeat-associated protein
MRLSRCVPATVLLVASIGVVAGAAGARPAARAERAASHRSTAASPPGVAYASPYVAGRKASGTSTTAVASATGTPKVFHAPSFYNINQSQLPPENYTDMAMDYDAVRKEAVLFGGCNTASPCQTNETWTFDGDTWTKETPAASPPARNDEILVFDQARGNLVMFGGIGPAGQDLGDTWVWDGTNWTQKAPATSPSARHDAQAAYLPSIGKVVLFGGASGSSTYSAETWTWDGTNWTRLNPATSPVARSEAGLTYAGASAQLLLYGGRGAAGVLGDTWLFNGTAWTQKTPAATPGPLERFSIAYDPTLHVPLLVGGRDNLGTYFADVWAWDGTDWQIGGSNLRASWPNVPGEIDGAMSQTPTNGQLVYVGGQAPTIRIQDSYRIDYNDTGFQPAYNFADARLTDRSDDHANVASQDLVYRATDLDVSGVGLDLTIERQSNNLLGRVSHLLPLGWTLGLLDAYTFPLPDGARLLLGPDGHEYLFQKSGTGTWSAPAGSDFGTLADQADGTRTVTRQHPKLTYAFKNEYLVSVKDRNGNKIQVNRDASDKITSIVDTQNRTYSVGYHANGFLDHITDPTGRSVTYGYDAGNNLATVTVSDPNDPTGSAVTTYVYGPDGNDGWMSQVTTPAGHIVKYAYLGGMNRLTKIVRVDPATGTGPTTTFDAKAQPGKVLVSDPNAHTTTYTIDRSGTDHLARISKVTDANGHNRSSSYDANNNMTSVGGDAVSAVYNLTYDANDNMTAFKSPSSNGTNTGASTTFKYAAPGQSFLPSSMADPASRCRAFRYDTAGNLTDVYDGQNNPCDGLTGGTHLKNAYQGDTGVSCGAKVGELCSTTDGKGNVTSYGYDASGNLASVTPPAPLGQTTITSDGLGRPSLVTDGRGQQTRFKYDKDDRVTQLLVGGATTCDAPHASCIDYTYDKGGNLTGRVSNIGTTSYSYDAFGRLFRKSLPGPLVDACAGDTGMKIGYDAASNVTSYCDARGTVVYGYDAANELTSIQEPGGNCAANPVTGPCTKIAYVDATGKFQDGRRASVTYPPSTGAVSTLSYDNAGNLTSIVLKKGATTLASYSYTYNQGTVDVDQRQTMTDATGATTSYHYDGFGRLCWYASGTSTNACTTPPAGATSFTYDANGNRTKMVSGATTTNYAYNAADELCASSSGTPSCTTPTYTYDANGNLTSNPVFSSLVYNTKDQTTSRTPVGGSATTYSYADADQTERVAIGSRTLAWSPLGLAEESSDGGTFYTNDPTGSILGERVTNFGSNYYFVYDGLGSVVGVMDANGVVGKNYTYDPFGNVTVSGPSPVNSNLRFAAGYHEPAPHNLYQFGTRSYDPTIGRWTQQDAVAGSIENPGEIDPYVYVGDDPVDFVDPTGECYGCGLGLELAKAVRRGVRHVRHRILRGRTWYRANSPKIVKGTLRLASGIGCAQSVYAYSRDYNASNSKILKDFGSGVITCGIFALSK